MDNQDQERYPEYTIWETRQGFELWDVGYAPVSGRKVASSADCFAMKAAYALLKGAVLKDCWGKFA